MAFLAAFTLLCVLAPPLGADIVDAANAALDKALSDESLSSAAAKTTDPDTLIGLAVFASPALGEKLARQAAASAPDKEKLLLSMAVGWHFDAPTVDAFLKADPDNGLPHYLKALLLLDEGKPAEGVASFQDGVRAKFFNSYTAEICRAALKAADTLNLDPPARLLSTMRVYFSPGYPQGIFKSQAVVARMDSTSGKLPADVQARIPDDLIAMAEQLLRSGDCGRYSTLFVVKAALTRAYLLRGMAAPGSLADTVVADALAKYDWQASREARALDQITLTLNNMLRPAPATAQAVLGYSPELSPDDKAVFDKALAESRTQRARFLELASREAYGLMARQAVEGSLPAQKTPGLGDPGNSLVEAANAVGVAAEAVVRTARSAAKGPAFDTIQNLKQLGLACLMFAQDHAGAMPPDLDTLARGGYMRAPAILKSAITGKPFVYVGKDFRNDGADAVASGRTVLAYDDAVLPPDGRAVLFADGHVKVHSSAELDQFLGAREQSALTAGVASAARLKQLGIPCLMYAQDHDGYFPPDLDTLLRVGLVRSPAMLKSEVTGRPFAYVGSGVCNDGHHPNTGTTVIAYDDAVIPPDSRAVLFADGHMMIHPAAELDAFLKAQRAADPASAADARLKQLAMAFAMYTHDYNGRFPPDLDTLVTGGYARVAATGGVPESDVVTSAATGKPFVYAAKGLRIGKNETEKAKITAVAYDDSVIPPDNRVVLFADGHIVKDCPAAELEKLLKKPNK
jgi:prepilin-type processing-associated H-X9-DG protein